MKFNQIHRWDLTPREAIVLQEQLRERVVTEDRLGPVRVVAGIDAGYDQERQLTRAAVAVLDFPGLQLRAQAIAHRPTTFPYIPGLFSFREAPAVLAALEALDELPDLILYDGQGLAHPRRFGIACHVGIITGIPSIGVAKSRLIGHHEPVPDAVGAWQPLIDGGEIIGAALRTRAGTRPLYVSVGHLIGLPAAIEYVLRCTTRYRLPETTRWADRLASGHDAPPRST